MLIHLVVGKWYVYIYYKGSLSFYRKLPIQELLNWNGSSFFLKHIRNSTITSSIHVWRSIFRDRFYRPFLKYFITFAINRSSCKRDSSHIYSINGIRSFLQIGSTSTSWWWFTITISYSPLIVCINNFSSWRWARSAFLQLFSWGSRNRVFPSFRLRSIHALFGSYSLFTWAILKPSF